MAREQNKNNNKGLAFSESEDNLQQKTGSGGEAVPLKKPKKKKNAVTPLESKGDGAFEKRRGAQFAGSLRLWKEIFSTWRGL